MNLIKDWKTIENNTLITMKSWEELKDYIYKLQLRIEDLEKSRAKWKERAMSK